MKMKPMYPTKITVTISAMIAAALVGFMGGNYLTGEV